MIDIDDPNCNTATGTLEAIFEDNQNDGVMMDINSQVAQLNDFGQTGVQTSLGSPPSHNWHIFQGSGVQGCTPKTTTPVLVGAGTADVEGVAPQPVSEPEPTWWSTIKAEFAKGPKPGVLERLVDRSNPNYPISAYGTRISLDSNGNPVWHVGVVGPCGGENPTPALQGLVLAEFAKTSVKAPIVFERGRFATTSPVSLCGN